VSVGSASYQSTSHDLSREVVHFVLPTAQAPFLLDKKLHHEIQCFDAGLSDPFGLGEYQRLSVLQDFDLGLMTIFTGEWCVTVETFVHDDSEAPLVTTAIIHVSTDDFWRHILRRSYHRPCQTATLGTVSPVDNGFTDHRLVSGVRRHERCSERSL